MTNPIAIHVNRLNKTFRNEDGSSTPSLKNISLDIHVGEFFVFLGPSGSGKSTLLRLICGLDAPNSGDVEWRGVDKKNAAFVFQQFGLLPWLTVAENVGIGLIDSALTKAEQHRRVMERLGTLGLKKFADAYPRELSGGMKQRVGFARALVTDPKILFMDEPFSELDTFTAEELRQELIELWQKEKFTVVMVTHNVDEAIELADRVCVLTPRPGTVEAIVPIALKRPRNMRSKAVFALHDQLTELVKP
jgi:NitT/TauT family transport system ATP-binding protein